MWIGHDFILQLESLLKTINAFFLIQPPNLCSTQYKNGEMSWWCIQCLIDYVFISFRNPHVIGKKITCDFGIESMKRTPIQHRPLPGTIFECHEN